MTPLIELKNVTRRFGAFIALSDITLSLPPGRIGLLGPNGAGKSTLLKILMGLLPPSSGSGRVLDQELGGDGDSEGNWRLRRLHGIVACLGTDSPCPRDSRHRTGLRLSFPHSRA